MTDQIVIIGGGLGGARTAEALRDRGYTGSLTLIGAESALPYDRPPLSKGYLKGEEKREDVLLHPEEWWGDHDVDLRLGIQATDVLRGDRAVELADGSRVPYDALLLATGSRARQLPLAGADAEGVHTLRQIGDSDAIKNVISSASRLVVIGAGWIGLEIASAARGHGLDVTVLEAGPLPLLGPLGEEMARVFLNLHEQHGVTFHLGAQVEAINTEAGRATGVQLADGTSIPADAVVIGVGAQPNLELAQAAGLEIAPREEGGGVLVDEALQTSDPNIWAVGDIVSHPHPVLGRRLRVEHWANAYNMPLAAAPSMLGTPTPFTELPFFWTDQHDLGMEYIGDGAGAASVVTRGDVPGREFIAFWLDADRRVLAGMNVNVWDVVDEIKPLIISRTPVDVERLKDGDVPLPEVLR